MIQMLHRLGIDRRNLRSLAILPLVEVAWADGKLQPRELALIRKRTEELGLRHDDRLMVDEWLTYPPSQAYLRSAHAALGWLRKHGDPGLDPELLKSVLDDAWRVAAAAGGVFGIGAVCRAEKQTLAQLSADIERGDAPRAEVEDSHPDFVRRNGVVTLAWTNATLEESEGILTPLFDAPMRLPVPARGLVIGAGDQADVRILGDEGVGDQHCVVFPRPAEGFFAKAVGSAAVWLNGERIGERRLLGGETIRVTEATSFVFKFVRPVY
ncbi:MAG: hypothetical protein ABMA64_19100 [Myxococcota bacterium]